MIIFEQPFPWILEWVLNVVKMYQHALIQAGQDGKQFVVHIAGSLEDMGGVDEQDVVFIEFGERRNRHILNQPLDDINPGTVFLSKPAAKAIGVGIDASQVEVPETEMICGVEH